METSSPIRSVGRDQSEGSSLLLVMFTIAVVSVFVGLAISGTSEVARVSTRAQSYVNVEKATEGAVEYGFGIWKKRILAKASPLTQADLNANPLTGPTFPDMSYATASENGPLKITATDEYGAPAATATRVYTDLPAYPGYKGFSYGYTVSAKMRQTSGYGKGTVAGVKRQVVYVEVPTFQVHVVFRARSDHCPAGRDDYRRIDPYEFGPLPQWLHHRFAHDQRGCFLFG